MVFRRAYDLDHGIYTENYLAAHPYATIEMHPTERAANRGMLESLVEKYEVHRIKDNFNLSITEFLDLPNDFVQTLVRSSIRIARSESVDEKAARKLAEELKTMEENKLHGR